MQNSGDHMMFSILASLTSSLVGFVIMDNAANEAAVRRLLRNGRFNEMIDSLDMYYQFLGVAVTVSEFIHILSSYLKSNIYLIL